MNDEEQAEREEPASSQKSFPNHEQPRVWFLTAGESPVAVALARQLIDHGDLVVACISPINEEGSDLRRAELRTLVEELADSEDARSRFKVVGLDVRSIAQCQAAVAEAIGTFGRIDILFCCNSEALIGTIEELSQTPRTQSLIKDQFATNFFGPVNIIKASLASFRSQKKGHIILLTGITGHLGTPGLGMYCASQWAIEGYCDSLAYEVAPFNVKMSIVQSNIEISVLTNKITAVPPMDAYNPPTNSAPLARVIWGNVLDKLHETATSTSVSDSDPSAPSSTTAATTAQPLATTLKPSMILNGKRIASFLPPLLPMFKANLIAETVHVLVAIGGHENPPSRHIVGHEGVASVKEKLRTVSEELEDFVEVSAAVDL